MTDLTEQWKKGELPVGWYYVKVITEFEYPDDIAFYIGGYFELYSDEDIEQVLAPVPSYKEYTKLKELLKEANKFLKDYGFTFDGKDCAEAFKVHTKTNQVLGEDK